MEVGKVFQKLFAVDSYAGTLAISLAVVGYRRSEGIVILRSAKAVDSLLRIVVRNRPLDFLRGRSELEIC